jgi:lipopolysaccharide transport system permease protein
MLVARLVRRDLAERYRASFLGAAWAVLTPFLLLAIYTFVFNVVMKARWGQATGRLEFALAVFAGLMAFGVFSECAVMAPTLIVNHRHYVKKTAFPLEVLHVVILSSALVRALVGMVVLAAGVVIAGRATWGLLFVPLALLPISLMALGAAWFLSALGVFVRDMAQVVGLLVQALFFLTPIVYPVESVPDAVRPIAMLNPFTHLVGAARDAAIWGRMPGWGAFALACAVSLAVFVLGHAVFARCRRAFADVL